MATIAFQSRPLPGAVSPPLRQRLAQAHGSQPFSALDPREAVRRAASIAEELGLTVTVYRGSLDLSGSEVDHVWADLEGHVIDVAFPLFVPTFVDGLRRFVVGEIEVTELAAIAESAGVDERVLGEFPPPLRYRGEPVWSARR